MYIRGFDGLRAVSVFLVFFMHKTSWGTDCKVGLSGVWLFLLLSGFLIAGQLKAGRNAVEIGHSSIKQELWSFWIKRSLRIFPAYYVLIAVLVPFYLSTGRAVPGVNWYLFYLSNVHFQNEPSDFLTTWAHFWTLAVEQQFYVVFAPLMLFVPSRHATGACMALVALSLVQRAVLVGLGVAPASIYIDSLVNFGILALGAVLAINCSRIVSLLRRTGLAEGAVGWCALYCVIVCVPLAERLAGDEEVLLQACYALTVLMAALLLAVVLACQSSSLVRVLEGRFLIHCGRVSYGLYLYNDYVKADLPERLLRAASPRLWPHGGPRWAEAALAGGTAEAEVLGVIGLVVCFLVLLAIANVSWAIVERPALRLKARLAVFPFSKSRRHAWPRLDGAAAAALPEGLSSPGGTVGPAPAARSFDRWSARMRAVARAAPLYPP